MPACGNMEKLSGGIDRAQDFAIPREEDSDIREVPPYRAGQRPGNVGEAAGLREGCAFRGDEKDVDARWGHVAAGEGFGRTGRCTGPGPEGWANIPYRRACPVGRRCDWHWLERGCKRRGLGLAEIEIWVFFESGYMYLAGDVGGTKILLQLSGECEGRPGGEVLFERRYASSDFTGLMDAVGTFKDECSAAGVAIESIQSACFGVAGPVSDGRVKVTNLPWIVDERELSVALGIPRVRLVNDFEAAAHGIDAVSAKNIFTLQAGEQEARGHRIVLGAGTGFGVAYSLWTPTGRLAIAGEGGHMGFAPGNDVQAEFWREVCASEGRVAVERVLSGPGLVRLHDFFRRRTGVSLPPIRPAVDPEAVIAAARNGRDAAAASAVNLFVAAYGAVAGDHALAVMARGGVYLCGGIAPAILPELAAGSFLASFGAKGPHAGLMCGFPVHVVLEPRLCLHGARALAVRP